jgi:hypothetical protein
MSRENAPQAGGEQHVRDLLGVPLIEPTAMPHAGDLQQRSLQTFGIARELYGRCVREALATPAHGRLDQPSAESADRADDREAGADQQQVGAAFVAATAR